MNEGCEHCRHPEAVSSMHSKINLRLSHVWTHAFWSTNREQRFMNTIREWRTMNKESETTNPEGWFMTKESSGMNNETRFITQNRKEGFVYNDSWISNRKEGILNEDRWFLHLLCIMTHDWAGELWSLHVDAEEMINIHLMPVIKFLKNIDQGGCHVRSRSFKLFLNCFKSLEVLYSSLTQLLPPDRARAWGSCLWRNDRMGECQTGVLWHCDEVCPQEGAM